MFSFFAVYIVFVVINSPIDPGKQRHLYYRKICFKNDLVLHYTKFERAHIQLHKFMEQPFTNLLSPERKNFFRGIVILLTQ